MKADDEPRAHNPPEQAQGAPAIQPPHTMTPSRLIAPHPVCACHHHRPGRPKPCDELKAEIAQ